MNKILRTLAMGALISYSFAMQAPWDVDKATIKAKVTCKDGAFFLCEDRVHIKCTGTMKIGIMTMQGPNATTTSKYINICGFKLNCDMTSEEFLTAIQSVIPDAILEKK